MMFGFNAVASTAGVAKLVSDFAKLVRGAAP
jgi:hypothetical protein